MKQCNPNTKGLEGWTALEIAATSGVIEIVQILVADKRTQYATGSERGSALHLAAQSPNGFKICQTLLLENPTMLQIKDANGNKPIDVCSSKNLQGLFERYSVD